MQITNSIDQPWTIFRISVSGPESPDFPVFCCICPVSPSPSQSPANPLSRSFDSSVQPSPLFRRVPLLGSALAGSTASPNTSLLHVKQAGSFFGHYVGISMGTPMCALHAVGRAEAGVALSIKRSGIERRNLLAEREDIGSTDTSRLLLFFLLLCPIESGAIFLAVVPSARRHLLSLSIASESDSDIGFADICLLCPVLGTSIAEVFHY